MQPDSPSPDPDIVLDLDTLVGTTGEPRPDSASVAAIAHATGTVIRQVRLARGLLLSQVSGECGVSASVLCRAELARREPRLRLLLTLCGVLGIRLSAVLRMAEETALPLGTQPWTDDPAELLGKSSPGCSAFLARDWSATPGWVDHG
jgi:transcriptional regulator with XRE-family HTH domain